MLHKMLHQGCLDDLKTGAISRKKGYVAITMRHYPRGLKKELRDEYIRALSPDEKLFKDFYHYKELLEGNHNAAFGAMRYEERFSLSEEAVAALRRLAEMSATREVYMLCICNEKQRCHRELLLLLARKWFDAQTDALRFAYPVFEKRVPTEPNAF